MTQIVIMLYEDPNKPVDAPDRFHVELHFSPGAKAHKEDSYPQGSGFRPSSKPNSRDVSRVYSNQSVVDHIGSYGLMSEILGVLISF